MKTSKLEELGARLIIAKKAFLEAEYDLLITKASVDISTRKRKIRDKLTETAIKSEVDESCRLEYNKMKLCEMKLSEIEILYEIEKMKIQYGQ